MDKKQESAVILKNFIIFTSKLSHKNKNFPVLIPIETERLILRPLKKSDAERLFLLDSNPEVMKYVGVAPLTRPEESENVISHIQKQYEEFGTGRFAVIEKSSGLLIGWNGLKFNPEKVHQHDNFYELGYRFLPEFWGKGFATESSLPFIKRAFKEMNLDQIYAYAHCENVASNHLLTKFGFLEKGKFLEPDGWCNWYELSSENYLENCKKE